MVLGDRILSARFGTLVLLTLGVASSYGQATFTPIVAPGGDFTESAALSTDGRYVGGYFDTPLGNSGFRWSLAGGFEELGRPIGTETYRNAYVRGISGDGSKVVGNGNDGSVAKPYVWQQSVGVTAPSLPYPTIVSVSADGSTYAGYGPGAIAGTVRSWRTVDGVSTDLGLVAGSVWTVAYGMSDDGRTIAGYSAFPGSPVMPVRPSVWQEGLGLSEIPLTAGTYGGYVQGVSRDGKSLTGTLAQTTDSDEVPFVWTASEGSRALDESLFPYGRTYTDYVTNGGMVLGKNDTSGPYSAVLWESATSPEQDLKTWLSVNYGLGTSLTGWNLEEIVSASPDGRTLLGNGQLNGQSRSFLIQLSPVPEPGSLLALGLGFGAVARRRSPRR